MILSCTTLPLYSAFPGIFTRMSMCCCSLLLLTRSHFCSTHKVVNLGKPSSQRPLKELSDKNGVEIEYIEGGMCVMNGTHEIRYTTKLLLICNRNVPIVSGQAAVGRMYTVYMYIQ